MTLNDVLKTVRLNEYESISAVGVGYIEGDFSGTEFQAESFYLGDPEKDEDHLFYVEDAGGVSEEPCSMIFDINQEVVIKANSFIEVVSTIGVHVELVFYKLQAIQLTAENPIAN